MPTPLPLIIPANSSTPASRTSGANRPDTSNSRAFSQVLAEQRAVKNDTTLSKSSAPTSDPSDASIQDGLLEDKTAKLDSDIVDDTQSLLAALPQQSSEIVVEATLEQIQIPPSTAQMPQPFVPTATEDTSTSALLGQVVGALPTLPQVVEDTDLSAAIAPQRTSSLAVMPKNHSESSVAIQNAAFSVVAEKGQTASKDAVVDDAPLPTSKAFTPTEEPQTPTAPPSHAGPIDTATPISATAVSPHIVQPIASATLPVVPTFQLQSRVGSLQWGPNLGQQLIMMSHNVQRGTQSAELRLDPPEIGPLRVTLSLHEGVAQASFFSAHAGVRQAVEAALPQLQQALAQSGISLGQISVGDHAADQQGFFAQQHSGSHRQNGDGHKAEDATETTPIAVTMVRASDAIVDTFA